jgi:hypothetical protein
MEQATTLLEEDEDLEIGPKEVLPSAITFCLENHQEVKHEDLYPKETTIKIGEIAFTKNAP